jgi:predicted nucleic acid-binding protein
VSGFLSDTNVVSEFIRPQPDAWVIRWLEAADPESLFASVVTFGEIRLGIEDLPVSKRRAALEEWPEQGLPQWFESHLLPGDESDCGSLGTAHNQGQEARDCNYHGRWSDCRDRS